MRRLSFRSSSRWQTYTWCLVVVVVVVLDAVRGEEEEEEEEEVLDEVSGQRP